MSTVGGGPAPTAIVPDPAATAVLPQAPLAQDPAPILRLRGVGKTYAMGSLQVQALRDIDLDIDEGEFVAVVGPSGSGKSTLMHILGCLDVPTEGSYELAGVDVSSMDERELAHVRNQRIGFVFQQFNLLPTLAAWRNVELPLVYAGVPRTERRERALEALGKVGLADRVDHRPGELSGGQQQRVSVARALVTDPDLILADVLGLLRGLHDQGRTIVLITHEHDIANLASRAVTIRDGMVEHHEPGEERRS